MTSGDRVRVIVMLVSVALLAHAAPARAQSAEAEALFREGRRLLKKGKIAEACDKLAASERLDSSVGTLLNLGDCRERLGKLASAWASFRQAESMARRSDNAEAEAEARRRAVRLEPRLSHLLIEVPDASRVDGLTITRDGDLVDPGMWNAKMPVDPGTYQIVVEAPGYHRWVETVFITSKERNLSIAVPLLEVAPAPPPGEIDDDGPAVDAAISARGERPRGMTITRKLSIAVGVLGAGALGTGVVFGLRARNLDADANERCPLEVCPDPEGLRLSSEAHQQALRANVLYAAGGVLVATAVVMWLVGGRDDDDDARRRTISVQPTYGAAGADDVGLTLAGSF